jgi:tryptophanyl-tRNA synthetase
MRVLSGIQPSGDFLHLGNYFGAIRQQIALADEHEALLFIADYHSMTTVRDGALRREYTLGVALDYLACGLDPERTILFRQSDVPEVTELAWMLSTVTPMGLLERGHAYKDRVAQGQPSDHGLFAYPVLQAADILLYRSDLVPVGQDQKQHIEMARDMAQRFNHTYGEDLLVVPEPFIPDAVAVVPGTDGRKMSKSYGNAVGITDGAREMTFGVMRLDDEAMETWFVQLTDVPAAEIAELLAGHPRRAKARLAREITACFHGVAAADEAAAAFDREVRDKELPDEVPEHPWDESWGEAIPLPNLLKAIGMVGSTSEARRGIKQGGLRLDGEVVTDPRSALEAGRAPVLVQLGKKRVARVVP